ncbi:alpha/beta fold hydrolase [Alteromonadaceae bacterium BrNp21-10]|nr:alpha/beta fold hydrolase [Alteromonadaceae bacterium BrNp21-10]
MRKILMLIIILSFTCNAKQEPWTNFAQLPIVEQPQVSPDGSKIALIYNTPDGPAVSVTAFATLEFDILATLKLGRDRVDSISWSGNENIVISTSYPQWYNGNFFRVSRLYAFNLVTKESKELTLRRFQKSQWYEYQSFNIISLLKNDDQNILVSTYDELDNGYSVFKVNVSTSKFTKVQNNEHDIDYWAADHLGTVRLGTTYEKKDNKITRTIWYRENAESELKKLYTRTLGEGVSFNVLGVTNKGDKAYILSDRETGRESLWLFDVVSGEFEELLYSNDKYDVTGALKNSLGELIGVYYSDDYFRKVYFNKSDSKQEMDIASILKSEQVTIVSKSQDKTKLLALKQSDNKPGTYFYFDLAKNKGGIWISEYPYLSKQKFPQIENYQFDASDGQSISGYVTFPENIDKPSLIVLPHGGPHSRDYKYFDPEVQYLVSLGYAVLQVNFRGSSGFGSAFETAGYNQWGKRMQQDVYEAMDWLIGTERVSKDKACIVGASYGGYVALTATFQQPTRFDCAISIAGVSDLKELILDEDYHDAYTGHVVDISDDKAIDALSTVSAINYIKKIQVPILLIHGTKDTRVPFSQSEDFYDDAKRKLDIKYVEIKNGTHFFDNLSNKQTRYKEVTQFLKQHL